MNTVLRYLILCGIAGGLVLGPLVESFVPEQRMWAGLVLSLLMAVAIWSNIKREREMEEGE